jgi:hypothetical protein
VLLVSATSMKTSGSPGIAGWKKPKQRRPVPSLRLRSYRLLIGCTACRNERYQKHPWLQPSVSQFTDRLETCRFSAEQMSFETTADPNSISGVQECLEQLVRMELLHNQIHLHNNTCHDMDVNNTLKEQFS